MAKSENEVSFYIGQLNPVIGAIEENASRAVEFYREAEAAGADYAILSELFLTSYGARDLFFRPRFLEDVENALGMIARACTGKTTLGIGAPIMRAGRRHIGYLYLREGRIEREVHKVNLPNYDVFDEKRHFVRGEIPGGFGEAPRLNTAICEDGWHDSYIGAIAGDLDILIAPNASPYYRGKLAERHANARLRAKALDAPVIYSHFVGLEDELIFDGGSFVMHPDGSIGAQLPLFEECSALIHFEKHIEGWRVVDGPMAKIPDEWESDYRAMVEGVKGYAAKTGFKSAILGLSGGIDSALVSAIATDALGAQNVRAFALPSEYTAPSSLADGAKCARALGIACDELPISPGIAPIHAMLTPALGGAPSGLTAENIQPRLRALLLMAIANQESALLLTTGNKSEVAVGYATLYGDMAGGFNPLKDLYKMRVFETARWRNANHRPWMKGPAGMAIPAEIIEKPPSAELRDDQKDSDSLPPYGELDPILEAMVDQDKSVDEIVAAGFDEAIVRRVQDLVLKAEFKRFQAAPGVKLSKRHFGTDRRYPIINGWKDKAGG